MGDRGDNKRLREIMLPQNGVKGPRNKRRGLLGELPGVIKKTSTDCLWRERHRQTGEGRGMDRGVTSTAEAKVGFSLVEQWPSPGPSGSSANRQGKHLELLLGTPISPGNPHLPSNQPVLPCRRIPLVPDTLLQCRLPVLMEEGSAPTQ